MDKGSFRAYLVTETEDNKFKREIVSRNISDLPDNDLLIRVKYSSLNYKDALSATGNKGVSRNYPHTPGIDAAGIVEKSRSSQFKPGDEVIVTGFDLGMNTSGGFAEYISIPASWAVPKPEQISLKESMILGTAGFTAGLSILRMEANGQTPEMGEVLVTGATGGLGCLALLILLKSGYKVIAGTRKKEEGIKYLKQLGVQSFAGTDETNDESGKLLLRPRWAGAIDVVGGNTLSTVIKACKPYGNIAVCGLVKSPDVKTTVFPFILNGISLIGIDSAECPVDKRFLVWKNLAGPWRLNELENITTNCELNEIDQYIDRILAGKLKGRVLVTI